MKVTQMVAAAMAVLALQGCASTIPREEINYWQNISDPATIKINAG